MGFSSISHLLILLVVVLLIFGPGRLSKVMGEFGKGIRSLRDGMGGEDKSGAAAPRIESDDHKPQA
jgi:sec-independent protein translocase protein TatA